MSAQPVGETLVGNGREGAPAESEYGVAEHAPSSVSVLTLAVEPISSDVSISEVGELFLAPGMQRFLSLPVIELGRPVGIISRYQLMKVFMKLYGREVYGKRPVADLMNTRPLLVEQGQSVAEASQFITENMNFPVMDDFIIVDGSRYVGMGIVTDVLKSMEQEVARHNAALSRAYAELKASQAQLVQSEKMASLGEMVAGVAHELNTPLGYVKNNVDLLAEMFEPAGRVIAVQGQVIEGLLSDEPDEMLIAGQLDVLETMREQFSTEALEDMTALVHDTLFGIGQIAELVVSLRNFARLDQAKVDRVNINDCLDSALVIGRNNIKNRAEVVKEYGELPRISCSPSQINQVFLNLLNNAAQSMKERGTIAIRTWSDEEYVGVDISDNGSGIPEDVLPRIFDPFFTTKPVGEGTGLGLSISFQIVEQHGGTMDVSSEPGVGTRFRIRLPQGAPEGNGCK